MAQVLRLGVYVNVGRFYVFLNLLRHFKLKLSLVTTVKTLSIEKRDWASTMSERDLKAKNEHWEIVINYMETYPQLLKNKFERSDGDSGERKKLWEKLTEHLNSLGYGRKSSDKWQLAIGRWKSKIKAKATTLRLEMERTGGGPAKTPPLTELEERLMAILGWKSILGDKNTEFGLEMAQPVAEEPQSGPSCVSNIQDFPLPQQHANASDVPALHFYKENGSQVPRKRITKRIIPKSTERSRKMVTLSQMHSGNLIVLKNIGKNVAILAEAVTDMKKDFREYLQYLRDRDT